MVKVRFSITENMLRENIMKISILRAALERALRVQLNLNSVQQNYRFFVHQNESILSMKFFPNRHQLYQESK